MRQLPALPSVSRRLAMALAVGLLGVLTIATPASANDPGDLDFIDWNPHPVSSAPPTATEPAAPSSRGSVPSVRRSPAVTRTPVPTPSPSPTPAENAAGVGYDISYPQCGTPYPEAFAFAIVGVDGGRVFTDNPCFVSGDHRSQLEWAGRDAELYFNTGNPGPRASSRWPTGQAEPRECDTRANRGEDTVDCAFVYGWNAAEDSFARALEGYVELGWADVDADRLPAGTTIWLDVEVANTWRSDWRLNIASLQGAVAYLESMKVERIGFYSTPRMWFRIVGWTDAFADYPAWHAGARSREDAERRCGGEGFTGGELVMVQWVEDRLDHNIRCSED